MDFWLQDASSRSGVSSKGVEYIHECMVKYLQSAPLFEKKCRFITKIDCF